MALMKSAEGLILVSRVLLYDGAARTLRRLAFEPQMAWAAGVWMVASLMKSFKLRASRPTPD